MDINGNIVSSEELPATYQSSSDPQDEVEEDSTKPVLYPLAPKLPKIELGNCEVATKIGRQYFDKIKCEPFPPEKAIWISKVHCIVQKNPYLLNSYMIEDCSSNGLYLNGVKVPKRAKTVLENCTEIALGKPSLKCYCFVNRDVIADDVVSKQYIAGRKLGSGGLGVVYKCFGAESGKPMAMKVIQKRALSQLSDSAEGSSDSDAVIQREIDILQRLSKLDHPNIVKLIDVLERPSKVVLVMDLCLEDMLVNLEKNKDVFKEQHARVCIIQVLFALNFLHCGKIIHRDLKLENILVSQPFPNLVVKLGDFGLSRMADQSQPKTICGTQHYLAPEIIEARVKGTRYSEKVDCWSAGVVLFVLLFKRFPFVAKKEMTVFDSILRDRPSIPPPSDKTISANAKDLVANLLHKNPLKRSDASKALQHVWFAN